MFDSLEEKSYDFKKDAAMFKSSAKKSKASSSGIKGMFSKLFSGGASKKSEEIKIDSKRRSRMMETKEIER